MALSRVAAGETGTVEGSIKYVPDLKRPWRFSRYYIQNPKNGFLAETVVALERPGLSSLASAPSPTKHTMDQVNFQFVPETLAIRAGDTVLISSSDDAPIRTTPMPIRTRSVGDFAVEARARARR